MEKTHISEELAAEAKTDIEKLSQVIYNIRSNPRNWIVSDIKKGPSFVSLVIWYPSSF